MSNRTIAQMLADIEAKRAAMPLTERAALEAAELTAQRESWIRAMAPCEHGDPDWETCPECRSARAALSRPAMTQPTKRQLLCAVAALNSLNQQMFSTYANDVSPNRAERMEALLKQSTRLAQPIIDAFPYEWLAKDTSHDH